MSLAALVNVCRTERFCSTSSLTSSVEKGRSISCEWQPSFSGLAPLAHDVMAKVPRDKVAEARLACEHTWIIPVGLWRPLADGPKSLGRSGSTEFSAWLTQRRLRRLIKSPSLP